MLHLIRLLILKNLLSEIKYCSSKKKNNRSFILNVGTLSRHSCFVGEKEYGTEAKLGFYSRFISSMNAENIIVIETELLLKYD